MKPPYFLKSLLLSPKARLVLRPMLLISLVLHGIVLLLPVSSENPKPPKPEEQVKVTQLLTTRPLPKSSPRSSPPSPTQATPSQRQPTRPRLSQPSPPTDSIVYPNQAKRTPSTQSESNRTASEESESSTSKSSISQSSNSTPSTGTTNLNTDTAEPNVKDPLEDFLRNFPFHENALVGSLGVLSGDADKSARNIKQPLGQVIKYYTKELDARNYTLASPITDDADFKIYQVSKGRISQYLHLISVGENTVIFLSEKQLDRSELKNLEAETAEEREFKAILRETISGAATRELTPDIMRQIAGGTYNDFGILLGKTPAQLGDEFSSALQEKGGFKVGQPRNWGKGGLIYSVEKNTFKGLIQLIPTEDGLGTAIISLDDLLYWQ